MKIINKEQFAKLPNGTVYCLYIPEELDECLQVKTGVFKSNDEYMLNGVTYICPDTYESYNNKPSMETEYTTQIFNTDTTLSDYDDEQLFAIFTKKEISMMIDALTCALSICEIN